MNQSDRDTAWAEFTKLSPQLAELAEKIADVTQRVTTADRVLIGAMVAMVQAEIACRHDVKNSNPE
jgi:hypothetical protein